MTPAPPAEKLSLWRTAAGIAVLGSLVAVLIALAPVYVRNYQLSREVRSLVASPAAVPDSDESLRMRILDRARQLNLPVRPGDVTIAHAGGRPRVELKYVVQMNLALYQVDLHFHSDAAGR